MNIKKIIGTVAPFLGAMVGGPFGGSIGAVLGKALLGNEKASLEDISLALGNASPEQLVKIREIDSAYKSKMAELGIDEKKLHALDRADARKFAKDTESYIPAILAIFLTIGFFGVLGTIMFYPVHSSSLSVVNIMLGSLGTAWISVITYYFGSSVGSKQKTYLLEPKS